MRYAQKQDKRGFFSNVTTVLPLSGLVGDHTGAFSGPGGHSRDRFRPNNPEMARPPHNSGQSRVSARGWEENQFYEDVSRLRRIGRCMGTHS